MNPEAMSDEMQALRRLLGDAPVVTPDSLTVGLGWLLATLKANLGKGDSGNACQEWGTVSQVATIYGVKRAQADTWVNRLVEHGKVRRWQSETESGARGVMRYNLSDIAKAWAVEQGTCHGNKR